MTQCFTWYLPSVPNATPPPPVFPQLWTLYLHVILLFAHVGRSSQGAAFIDNRFSNLAASKLVTVLCSPLSFYESRTFLVTLYVVSIRLQMLRTLTHGAKHTCCTPVANICLLFYAISAHPIPHLLICEEPPITTQSYFKPSLSLYSMFFFILMLSLLVVVVLWLLNTLRSLSTINRNAPVILRHLSPFSI